MTDPSLLEDDRKGAVLSDDGGGPDGQGTYRYKLWRTVTPPEQTTLDGDDDHETLAFILLNPSEADATNDDQTLRRCIGYARDWGYGLVVLGNLFALRATEPDELYQHPAPVGPENDDWLQRIAEEAEAIVAGWGHHGDLDDRGRVVHALLNRACPNTPVFALGTTAEGHPVHPLFQPASAEPEPFLYR